MKLDYAPIAKPEEESAFRELRREDIKVKAVKKMDKKKWTRSNWLGIWSHFCENGNELLDSINAYIFLTR
jgi:hypothetical protein